MTMLSPQADAESIIVHLKSRANADNVAGMARYGIVTDTALGISNTELRKLARQIGKNHERAKALWATNIREARLLAAFTAEPKKLTLDEARTWAADFNSWEIVDGTVDLFVKAGHLSLISEFAASDHEFVRRAAFVMIASAAVHMKKEPDAYILAWLPLIEKHATDPRNFVKKAVNWALRQIGKRSLACHAPALALAQKLAESENKTERWIGRDAERELTAAKTRARLNRR